MKTHSIQKRLLALLLAVVLVFPTSTAEAANTPANAKISAPANCSIEYKKGKRYSLPVRTNSNGRITYSSSNPKVATVSQKGVITLNGTGVSLVTVWTASTSNYNAAKKTIRVVSWKQPAYLKYSSSYKKGKYFKRLRKLQLYGTTRDNLLTIAASQLGYRESSSKKKLAGNRKSNRNYTEYGRYYGMNGAPWCAIFVNWVARHHKISRSVVPKYSAVRKYYSFYKKRHRVRSWAQVRTKKYTPQKGDLIFYSYSYRGTTHHIGFVESVQRVGSKIKITTIEGNRSNRVRRVKMNLSTSNKKGKVSRSYYLTGFASPKY